MKKRMILVGFRQSFMQCFISYNGNVRNKMKASPQPSPKETKAHPQPFPKGRKAHPQPFPKGREL